MKWLLNLIYITTKDHPFDKGSGFVILSEGDAIKKIEEQLGKAKVINEDPTQKYTNKIQKHLCKLRKGKKFTDKEYSEIYIPFGSDYTKVIWSS